ncbi:hypothetical protein SDC9_25465 [bioreactor metagenome]|uniref:Type I restriction modification DNA specificity domain-containing protein n=1 Tax=bioreactor metagenome TaxID=1076179 RepID=A0A644UL07_9ZZZZ
MKKGWEIKTLGEVCDKASSNIAQNKLNDNEGIYPIYGASGFIKNIDFYQQENEYIAIVKDGSGVGRVTLYPEKSSVLGTLQYIIPNEKVTTRYIYYFLNSIDFDKYKCGAAIPHIYFKDYSNESIPIPPIKEQEEIVERLDKGFELIDSLKETAKKNLYNAKELFQSVLREELSPKQGWETKTLGEVAQIKGGNAFKSQDFIKSGKYQVLRMGNVKPGLIKENENPVYINEIQKEALEKALLRVNDIVITQTGTRYKRDYGYTAIINKENYLLNQRLSLIRLNKGFSPFFYLYYTWSDYFKDQFFKNETGTVGQGNVGIQAIYNAVVPIPELKEQEEIVNRLDRIKGYCEELEGNYKRVLELCEELKQGLLREAFSY